MLPALLKKPNSFSFWIAFIKGLREGRQSILDRLAKKEAPKSVEAALNPFSTADAPSANFSQDSTTEPTAPAQSVATPVATQSVVDDLMRQCLQVAASQWLAAPVQATSRYGYYHTTSTVAYTSKVDRIIEIFDHAIASGDMDICRTLIINILKSPGTTSDKFTQIYTSLIPRVRTLLSSKNVDLCTPPFVDLLQVLIGTYLRDVLGKKVTTTVQLRKIGCGCHDCHPVDAFIMNPQSTTSVFRLVQHRRLHLEKYIAQARDLCTYTVIKSGSPHGVQVTKRPEVISASMWVQRHKDAKAFLASIGSDEVIAKIMGARYPDVAHAINGTHVFGSVRAAAELPAISVIAPSTVAHPSAVPSSSSSDPSTPLVAIGGNQLPSLTNQNHSASSSSLVSAPTPVVPPGSKKRKNVVQLGPVIDLTADDSS